jgi:hypothetical protein
VEQIELLARFAAGLNRQALADSLSRIGSQLRPNDGLTAARNPPNEAATVQVDTGAPAARKTAAKRSRVGTKKR